MIIGAKAIRATDQRGTENETADELHGQYHGVVIVERMYGYGEQILEQWNTYFGEKK